MKPTYEELEPQLEESRREFRAADATIHNLELQLTDLAVQLANAESKCRELAAESGVLKKAAEFATAPDMWIEQADGMLDYRYFEWYVDVLKAAMETPATDAFMAEVRAQVVPDEMTPVQASRTYGGEVRGYRDGWNACRAAMLQASNSPVTPDGWVACSERMPEGMTDVHISNGHDVGQGWWDGDTWQTQHDYYSVPGDVTHWLSLPAAPQQEVKSALEHGMRRYAGAMQKLSEGDD